MENMDKYNYFNNSKNDKIPIFKYCNGKSWHYFDENLIFLQEKFEYFIKEKQFFLKVINHIYFINWDNENKEKDDCSKQI